MSRYPSLQTQLEAFKNQYEKIKTLDELLEFIRTHYSLNEIKTIPQSSLSKAEIDKKIIDRDKIQIAEWQFHKTDIYSFEHFAWDVFKKFNQMLSEYKQDESVGNISKLELLNKLLSNVTELKFKHKPETRFSITDRIIATTRSSDLGDLEVPLVALCNKKEWEEIFDQFELRAELFHAIEVRIKYEVESMNKMFDTAVLVKPVGSEPKYIIYEFVAGIKASNFFKINPSEADKLEMKLFKLLNVPLPEKRSKIIGYINQNQDKAMHLRKLIDAIPRDKDIK